MWLTKTIYVFYSAFLQFFGYIQLKDVRGIGSFKQDWGFLTVRQNAHMFYWLFYTTALTKNYTDRPLIIWLQGGPGMTSTGYGLFGEIGPLDLNMEQRKYSWIADFNVLFVDNPVGVGFSYFSNNDTTYARNNKHIGRDLVKFLSLFLSKHPEFQEVPLYIFGESYGGKMVVEFAYQLSLKLQKNAIKCNLKGIGLGDAYISPCDTISQYGPLGLHLGFLDQINYKIMEDLTRKCQMLIRNKNYSEALDYERQITTHLTKAMAGVDVYNFAELANITTLPKFWQDGLRYNDLMNNDIKQLLNITQDIIWDFFGNDVYESLQDNLLKSATDRVEYLLENTDINIIVYNGVFDFIVNPSGTAMWLNNLRWKYQETWKQTTQVPLTIKEVVEAFSKRVDKLVFYTIFRAGHSVPVDNPAAIYEILEVELLGNA